MLVFSWLIGLPCIMLLVYIAVKDFLVKHRLSESGFKNVLFGIVIFLGLVFGLSICTGANNISNLNGKVENLNINDSSNTKDLEQAKKDIIENESIIKKSFIYLSLDLIVIVLIRKNIKKEIDNNLNKPKKRWDDTLKK